jgi:GTP-binding protein
MPGIIAGAHTGKGLGLTFLRHIERTKMIVLVIDLTIPQPLNQYHELMHEFTCYSVNIAAKPRIVVFNKIDIANRDRSYELAEPTFYVSALTGQGIDVLAKHLPL